MKKLIVAVALAFAFLVAGPGGGTGFAEAKGWCKKHAEKSFCLKKEARKAKREARKDARRVEKKTTLFGAHRDRGRDGWGHRPSYRPYYRPHPRPGWGYRPDGSEFWTGAIIGGIIGNLWGRNDAEEPENDAELVVLKPFTTEWYEYCAGKYQSFDAKTGFYVTNEGQKKFCT
jgi:hypothetical protein